MLITPAEPPEGAPWSEVLASGVRRSWLANEEFGGSGAGQVSVLALPAMYTLRFDASGAERICVLVEGAAELGTTNKHTTAVDRGAVIHSRSGGAFSVRGGSVTTKLLILSQTRHGGGEVVERRLAVAESATPVEYFSLYDVKDEVLHQPEAGFFQMGTRMLLNAGQGGYQTFIFGQSSFAHNGGVHALHRHPGADEIFYVWEGEGAHLDGDGTEHRMRSGDAVLVPRSEWHGFRNTGARPVRAFFCLMGTGVMQRAGNEVIQNGAPVDAFAVRTPGQSGPNWITEASGAGRLLDAKSTTS